MSELTGEALYQEYVSIFPQPYRQVEFANIHPSARERWEQLATNISQKLGTKKGEKE